MKEIEKLANDHVLENVNPSDWVERAPDQVAAECYQAGFCKAREMAAELVRDDDICDGKEYAVASKLERIGESEVSE